MPRPRPESEPSPTPELPSVQVDTSSIDQVYERILQNSRLPDFATLDPFDDESDEQESDTAPLDISRIAGNPLQERLNRIVRLLNDNEDNGADDPAHGYTDDDEEDGDPIYAFDEEGEPINSYSEFTAWREELAREFNSIQRATARSETNPQQHFDERQRQREERDRRAAQERSGEEARAAWRVIEQINRGRSRSNQLDSMCDSCFQGINTRADEGVRVGHDMICLNCIDRYYVHCNHCSDLHLVQAMYQTSNGRLLCETCVHNETLCKACTECNRPVFTSEQHLKDGKPYCRACYSDLVEPNEPIMESNVHIDPYECQWREFTDRKLKAYCSADEGKTIKTKRVFSAELETKYPTVEDFNKVMTIDFPRHLGAEYDGSISSHGAEFQTPKLQGKNGEQFIEKLTTALQARGFKTDKTTGLHIHLDGGDDFIAGKGNDTRGHRGDAVKRLFLFYILFEDVIHSFLPLSRRINNFCKPMRDNFHLEEIANAQNLDDLEKIWYRTRNRASVADCKRSKKHGSRYSGVNFHTLLSDNHLEIRYHSGTINGRKILEWINLHGRIMDRIAEGKITLPMLMACRELLSLKDKTDKFFSLVQLATQSKKYFLRRQAKFMETPKDEEDTMEAEAKGKTLSAVPF